MLNFPPDGMPDPMVLTSLTEEVAASTNYVGINGSSSAYTVPGANAATFVPVRLSQSHTYVKAFWVNGAAVSGNIDVGIYTLSGTTATRIGASTAEAQSGASVVQVATTFSSVTVGPGIYYLALSTTSATSAFWRAGQAIVGMQRQLGVYTCASASPLPSSCTVAMTGATVVPLFGLSEVSVV